MTPLAPEDRAALVAELREAPLYNIDDEASAAPGEAADEIEALAARVEALEARVPKAKPLEWHEDQHGIWWAKSSFGKYLVGYDDGWWAQLDGPAGWDWDSPEDPRSYLGPYAAAAAAEADHQSRFKATWNGWE